MAASVRFEDEAFSDGRYDHLASLIGTNRFEVMGRCAYLWRQCTQEQTYVLPESFVRVYVDPDKLIEARLAERVDGGLRIKGTEGRIEWLGKLRANGRKGGRPKTKSEPNGYPVANQELTRTEPPSNPPAPAPVKDLVVLGGSDSVERTVTAGDLNKQLEQSWSWSISPKWWPQYHALEPFSPAEVRAAVFAVQRTLETEGGKPNPGLLLRKLQDGRRPVRDPPPGGQRVLARSVSRQDQSFEEAIRGVEAFNATRR